MNYKKLPLLVTILGIFSGVFAQDASFTWSPVSTIEYKGEENVKIVNAEEDELILLRKADGPIVANYYYEVIKYNNSMAQVYKAVVSPKYGTTHNNQGLIDVVYANGSVLVFYHHYVKEDGVTYIEYSEVDDGGDVSEVTRIGSVPTEKYGKTPDFKMAVAPDGGKIGVIAEMPREKEMGEKWTVWFYAGDEPKETDGKEIVLEVESERTTFNEYFISNTGNLQVFKKWKVKKEGYKYAVFTVSPSGTVSKAMMDIGVLDVNSKKIFQNTDGNLVVCGLYDGDGTFNSFPEGTFVAVFDADGSIKSTTVENFGKMVLGLVYAGGRAEKDDAVITHQLQDVIEDDNGELVMILEKFTEFELFVKGSTDPFAKDYDRKHTNTIVIRLTPDGKKKWAQIFEKEQAYVTRNQRKYWGGTMNLLNDGNLYLIYNFTNLVKMPPHGDGWTDAGGKKHYKSEFGSRAYYATFIAGIDSTGSSMFTKLGYKNSLPLTDMYKGAIYDVTFSSTFYGRVDNTLYLIMEMPAGATAGGTKWQVCKITVD